MKNSRRNKMATAAQKSHGKMKNSRQNKKATAKQKSRGKIKIVAAKQKKPR